MKILRKRIGKNGHEVLTVELAPGELLRVFHPDGYYRLAGGNANDDIVHGSTVADAERVTWCDGEQNWVA
jgi:hypothetical protein